MALPLAEGAKLARCHAMRKFPAHIAVGELSHTSVEHGLENGSFVLNSRALEYVIACVGGSLLRRLFRLLMVLMNSLSCLRDYSIRMVTELRRQITVPLQYYFLRLDLLLVACPMRGNLCSACAVSSGNRQ